MRESLGHTDDGLLEGKPRLAVDRGRWNHEPRRRKLSVNLTGVSMRRALCSVFLICAIACRGASPDSYLFLWAGDAEHKASDFLAVIDANPRSPRYATVVASIPTGLPGSHPHHTELEMPAGGHLLANGFAAGSHLAVRSDGTREAAAPHGV